MNSPQRKNLWTVALIVTVIIVGLVIWTAITPNSEQSPEILAEPLTKNSADVSPETPAVYIEKTITATAIPVITSEGAPAAASTPAASPTLTRTPAPPTETSTPTYITHLIEAGEAPLIIAAAYNVAVDEVLTLNQISDPTTLQIGQELVIPITVTPTPATPSPTPSPTPKPVIHTVESGDTLSGLGTQYQVNAAIIKLANELVGSQNLHIGQQLVIPVSHISPDIPVQIHTVAGGDTFDRLAFLYGSTIEDVMAANPNVEPTALRIGQQVIVPVTAPPVNPAANPQAAQIIWAEPMPPELVMLQQQMLDSTNAERVANGLPTLQADHELAEIALSHGQDMIKRGYFAHVTPEGIDLRTRFAQHGVGANWVGENIQFNTRPKNETVTSAITWLMNSAPHRANMLHSRFTHLGVGVVEEPTGWYTFVLVFAQYGSSSENDLPNGESGDNN